MRCLCLEISSASRLFTAPPTDTHPLTLTHPPLPTLRCSSSVLALYKATLLLASLISLINSLQPSSEPHSPLGRPLNTMTGWISEEGREGGGRRLFSLCLWVLLCMPVFLCHSPPTHSLTFSLGLLAQPPLPVGGVLWATAGGVPAICASVSQRKSRVATVSCGKKRVCALCVLFVLCVDGTTSNPARMVNCAEWP